MCRVSKTHWQQDTQRIKFSLPVAQARLPTRVPLAPYIWTCTTPSSLGWRTPTNARPLPTSTHTHIHTRAHQHQAPLYGLEKVSSSSKTGDCALSDLQRRTLFRAIIEPGTVRTPSRASITIPAWASLPPCPNKYTDGRECDHRTLLHHKKVK
jgi:hypothetical protein